MLTVTKKLINLPHFSLFIKNPSSCSGYDSQLGNRELFFILLGGCMQTLKRWLLPVLLMIPFYSFGQNLTVIGVGKLGLCLALNFERVGHSVVGVDVSEDYVTSLNDKSWKSNEPGMSELLESSVDFHATTSLEEGLNHADICFILVSTTFETDSYNFAILDQVLRDINAQAIRDKHIVICSTVIPGYIKHRASQLLEDCENVTLSYNAPFVAQGSIHHNLTHPDMVLIGQGNEEVGDFLQELYSDVCENEPYFARLSVQSGEITKLALNCAVTNKIALANLVGDIADQTPGADKYAILKAVGNDTRIGNKYFRPGYAYGGPCFTRDNRLLATYSEQVGIEPHIFRGTDRSNEEHSLLMAKKLIEQDREEYRFKDVSFKPNCPVKIIEFSQKLAVAVHVAKAGKSVTIVDTQEAVDLVKKEHGDLFQYIVKE